MKYRADIDGLRAVSILAVVAFHVGVPYIHSGYVGVDVFFVISGFLITKLLLEEKVRTGNIDLLGFWARRVRRLLPSLLFVMVTTLIAALFFLERVSGEIGNLAKASIAALFLNANHHFLLVAGDYFGAVAEMNPFLHLWTLSVEEQFYIVWPALLLFVASRREYLRKVLIVGVGLVSFIACVVLTLTMRDWAFFLMPARAWEFMAGAALAVLHLRVVRQNKPQGALLAIFGALLLIYSIIFLENVSSFPGFQALLPVAGAALTILAGTLWPKNPVSAVLQLPLTAYVGRISYVWYLWHWPILVFARSADLYEKSLDHDLLAAAFSFILAALTHHYVEAPLRRYGSDNPRWDSKRTLFIGISSTAAICMCSVLMGAWARFGWFYSENERYLDAARKDLPSFECLFTEGDNAKAYEKCVEAGARANSSFLLWGDSHANHWMPALTGAASEAGASVVVLSRRACMPILGAIHDKGCMLFNRYVFDKLGEMRRSGLSGVVLSARWPEYLGAKPISIGDRGSETPFFIEAERAGVVSVFEVRLQDLLHELGKMNLRVLIVLPSPILRHAAVQCLARRSPDECGISQVAFNQYAGDSVSAIKRVAGRLQNVQLVDPQEIMCRDGFCSAKQNGVIAYSDDDHLTTRFVVGLTPIFGKEIAWLMTRSQK